MSRSARTGWMQRGRKAAGAVIFTLLAGCGGGGGDLPRLPSPNEVYNIAQFFLFFLTGSGTWVLDGVGDDGEQYTITLEMDAGSGAFFPFPLTGDLGERSLQTVTIEKNGVRILQIGDQIYFDPAARTIYGTRRNGACSAVTSSATLPADAEPGASGDLNRSADYAGCLGSTTPIGNSVRRWSVENEVTTVFACNTRRAFDTTGRLVSTEQVCLQLASDGKVKSGGKARITWPVPGGFSVTARN